MIRYDLKHDTMYYGIHDTMYYGIKGLSSGFTHVFCEFITLVALQNNQSALCTFHSSSMHGHQLTRTEKLTYIWNTSFSVDSQLIFMR
jgi:hypothetical protein